MKNRKAMKPIQLKMRKMINELNIDDGLMLSCYLPRFDDPDLVEDSNTSPYFTSHANLRLSHRGINRSMIEDTIKYGIKICKQGLCFYVMQAKLIPGWIDQKYAEKIKNIVVVMKRPDIVLTVYKNNNAMRNIMKKPKRLKRNTVNGFFEYSKTSKIL